MKNRALRTIKFLHEAGQAGVHSFVLNGLLGTNYSPRAIHEARQMGYDISEKMERVGHSWGVRYFLRKSPVDLGKSQYTFDPVRQVFVYQ